MTATLNPEALKHYRKKQGWSQQRLAEESKGKVSKAQISRYERGQQTSRIRENTRKGLCDALHVKWERLTRPHDSKEFHKLHDRVALKEGISRSARTALTFVQRYFGLREKDIIDLAPLAFLILAERSLQARQMALDETLQALQDATADARRRLPYLPGDFRYRDDDEWINAEQQSLKKREVYEHYGDYGGEEMSPFVVFLEKELKALGLFKGHPMEFVPNYLCAPDYAMPIEIIAQSVGLDAGDQADRPVLELIRDGDIALSQAWEKKEGATEEDYRKWLVEQQAATKEEHQRRFSELARLIFDQDSPADANSDGDNANEEDQS